LQTEYIRLLSFWGQDTFTITTNESSGSRGLKPGEALLGSGESATFHVAMSDGACGQDRARNAANRAAAAGFATFADTTSLLTPKDPTTHSIAADPSDLQGSADDSCS
jgi:hypothetical protein